MPRSVCTFLGILAIGGGALGLVVTAMQLGGAMHSLAMVLLLLLFAAAYMFSIWCGVAILQRRPGWLRMNRILWGAQVVSIASPLLSYSFSSGAMLMMWCRFSPWGAGVQTRLGSSFDIAMGRDSHVSLGLNLFALAITLYLARKARHRVTARQISA